MAAEKFLESRGYGGMKEENSSESGNVMSFVFISETQNAARLDAAAKLSVALDDGSIYAFSIENYDADGEELVWKINEEDAKKALPAGKNAKGVRKTVIKSSGGRAVPCYELSLEGARVYVNAETGKQQGIVLE